MLCLHLNETERTHLSIQATILGRGGSIEMRHVVERHPHNGIHFALWANTAPVAESIGFGFSFSRT
jgi:hypothetical protein